MKIYFLFKHYITASILVIILLISIIAGCKKENSGSPIASQPTNIGGITLSFEKSSIPPDVFSIIATLSRDGYESLHRSMNFLTDTSAEVFFDEVPIGTWNLDVKAYGIDSALKYQGTAVVIILDGQTTVVNLTMEQVATGVGSVQITVMWGTAPEIQWNNWIHYSRNPVLADFDSLNGNIGVSLPFLFVDNSKLKMAFMYLASHGQGLQRGVGLAESEDGEHWSVKHGPVLTPGSANSWDSYLIGPGPVYKVGGTYRMLYSGSTASLRYNVGLATSADGLVWTKSGSPIFSSQGNWDYTLGACDVILANGKYYLYINCSGNGVNSIALATSTNGIDWERYGTSPIISASQDWEGSGVYCPSVIYENGTFVMMYMSQAGSQFGIATSTDGINWNKNADNPVIVKNGTHASWAKDEIAYPYLRKFKNQYIVYYSGFISSPLQYKIGFAILAQ